MSASNACALHYAPGVVDDIMVVGVGGQGVIVAAAVVADAALLNGGLEVKLSETRGMSQRGGSVSSHIRIGKRVVAPSISPGEVDYLLAFEAAEGLRAAPALTPDGVAIVNTQQIVPPLASQGEHSYPFDAAERMAAAGHRRRGRRRQRRGARGRRPQGGRHRAGRRALQAPALRGGDLAAGHRPQRPEELVRAEPGGVRRRQGGGGPMRPAAEAPRAAGPASEAVRAAGPAQEAARAPGPALEAVRAVGPAAAASAPDDAYFDPAAETLEVEALRALQLERLQAMVARSYEGSAVYRQLCDDAGVSPADVRTLDDVRLLPFIDKHTLRDCYPAGMRLCGLENVIEVHSTSGTTGKPTPIWASRLEMDAWALRNAREMWMVGLRPGDLLQNCFGYGLPTSVGLQYGAQRAGIGVVPAGIGRQELLIDLILDLGVTAICTTPSYGLYLADKAKERGLDLARDSHLRIGLFGAEPWPESGRDRLTEAMGVEPFNEFGMGEFLGPGMAAECTREERHARLGRPPTGGVHRP